MQSYYYDLHVHTHIHAYIIPYKGKPLREKTSAFFVVSEPSAKVFSTKFCKIRNAHITCIYAGELSMREGHTYIIIGPKQSAKVFSAKFSFCTETQTFSPSKVFCCTVHARTHHLHTHAHLRDEHKCHNHCASQDKTCTRYHSVGIDQLVCRVRHNDHC